MFEPEEMDFNPIVGVLDTEIRECVPPEFVTPETPEDVPADHPPTPFKNSEAFPLRFIAATVPASDILESVRDGMSFATRALKDGAAAPPPVGPEKTVFADWLVSENESAGVVVAVATAVVKSGLRFPEEKLVTVPDPPPPPDPVAFTTRLPREGL